MEAFLIDSTLITTITLACYQIQLSHVHLTVFVGGVAYIAWYKENVLNKVGGSISLIPGTDHSHDVVTAV